MKTRNCDEYISNRAWFRDIIANQPLILRGQSALEFLEYFDGFIGEENIYVYAFNNSKFENIHCTIIDSFDRIDYVKQGNVLCSTFSQAINDMLFDLQSDDQIICEALSNYYYESNETFSNLKIRPENLKRYLSLKNCALRFYGE